VNSTALNVSQGAKVEGHTDLEPQRVGLGFVSRCEHHLFELLYRYTRHELGEPERLIIDQIAKGLCVEEEMENDRCACSEVFRSRLPGKHIAADPPSLTPKRQSFA
jgi:hypothetical protein